MLYKDMSNRFLSECTLAQNGGVWRKSRTYTVLHTGQQQIYQLSEHYIIFKTEFPDIQYNISQHYIIFTSFTSRQGLVQLVLSFFFFP